MSPSNPIPEPSPRSRPDTGPGPRRTLAGLRRKPLSPPNVQAPDLTTAGVISRIDAPHNLQNGTPKSKSEPKPLAKVLPERQQRRITEPLPGTETDFNQQAAEQMLRLHATALIDRLQAWANDLDAREANLNARSAMQDHSERSFRLKRQSFEIEMAEQERQVERLKQRIEQHARRLAFATS